MMFDRPSEFAARVRHEWAWVRFLSGCAWDAFRARVREVLR